MASQILAGSKGTYKPIHAQSWQGATDFVVVLDTCFDSTMIKVKFSDAVNNDSMVYMNRCTFTDLKTSDFQGS